MGYGEYVIMWDTFLSNAGSAMNLTASQAGIVLSIIFTGLASLVSGIGTRSAIAVLGAGTLGMVFFTAVGWFPQWTGAILGIIFGYLFTREILN